MHIKMPFAKGVSTTCRSIGPIALPFRLQLLGQYKSRVLITILFEAHGDICTIHTAPVTELIMRNQAEVNGHTTIRTWLENPTLSASHNAMEDVRSTTPHKE